MAGEPDLRQTLADRAAATAGELARQASSLPEGSEVRRRLDAARRAAGLVAASASRPPEPERSRATSDE